ncbi:hypothetical protein A2W24_00425 [Microgenomates group bacterium RBG_16_45_19]|nr:MAG: hypothetical protein A2W24_00425 [Microgenomates group bacterium RBG_16_45_19]
MLYQINLPILDQIESISTFDIQQDLGVYVSAIVGALLTVAGLAAFLFLVWGGLNWVMAGGDKGKVEEARTRITNAVIGLAIVAAAWAIFLLLDFFFGLNIAQ